MLTGSDNIAAVRSAGFVNAIALLHTDPPDHPAIAAGVLPTIV
jgi:hypothetical protein